MVFQIALRVGAFERGACGLQPCRRCSAAFCGLIERGVRFLGNMSSKCSLLKSQHVGYGHFCSRKDFALGVQWFTSAVGKHPRHQNKSFQVFELWTFPGVFMSMMYTCAWRIEGSICRPFANLAPKNH